MRSTVVALVVLLAMMVVGPSACCAADSYTTTGLLDVMWTDGAWVGPPDALVTTDLAKLEAGQADMVLVAFDLPYIGEGTMATYRDIIPEPDAGKEYTYFVKHVARDAGAVVIAESDWCQTGSIARVDLTSPTGCGVYPVND